jgi:hypothetical protein
MGGNPQPRAMPLAADRNKKEHAMRRPPPERPNLLASFAREVLDDTRAKLIDEGWFQRPKAERQGILDDLRSLYGRDPEPPKGWGQPDWTDRLKERPANGWAGMDWSERGEVEPRSRGDDDVPEIDR